MRGIKPALRLGSVVTLLTLLLATATAQMTYAEAPQLAARVAAGELPPVEERLPENPMVVPVVERIGEYGGSWRTALLGGADFAWLRRTITYEGLLRWDPAWETIIPNLAESYESNNTATEFTFRLRQGVKWSDGQPFTADDIMFWYEDVFLNLELTPTQQAWLIAGGEPVVIEAPDEYTVVFRFAAPNGLFLQYLTGPFGTEIISTHPRHYLERFHQTHNPDIDQLVAADPNAADWISLFENQADLYNNSERPTLFAWQWTSAVGEGTEQAVAERNPYYWKVDPEGNQLPYIDRVVFPYVTDPEVLVLRAISGEVDMMDRHIATLGNRPILFDNMERGNYQFFETIPSQMNTMTLLINHAHKDPAMREVIQNRDFRIGLSHAINREEIIDLVYIGQGEPWQSAPRPESEFYNERLAKQYTEYDVDLANEHLDRAFPERDAQGFRVRSGGQRISLTIMVTEAVRPEHVDILELIQEYWRAVGVEMHMAVMDRALMFTRAEANEHDAMVWTGDGGMKDAFIDPTRYMTTRDWGSIWAGAWGRWFANPEDPLAIEPSDAAKRQMDLYDQIIATASLEEQVDLFRQILDIAQEEFYVIGISLPTLSYGIVRNDFHNVPEIMPQSFQYPTPGPTNPEQYFRSGN